MFKHYLITRFNIVLDDPKLGVDKSGGAVQTDEWLELRFDLFERYTLPSVRNQSCSDFRWIVLFYSATPERFRKRIEQYRATMPQFVPIYVDAGVDAKSVVVDYIKANCREEFVITTRIDNDDVMHRDYLGRIQEVFEPRENIFLCFRSGAQYIEQGCVMRRFNYIKNHYFSRIEWMGSVDTALCNHTKIHKIGELVIYDDEYMWVEIVHSGNLCNREKRLMQTTIENTAEKFGVELEQSAVPYFSFGYLAGVISYYCKIAVESLKYGSSRAQLPPPPIPISCVLAC